MHISEYYGRQLDIFDPVEHGQKTMTIIGAGGLGSPFAVLAAKMGFQLIAVYDKDDIEEHNLSNQFHRRSELRMKKVEGLCDFMKDMSPTPEVVEFVGIDEFVDEKTDIQTDIVVLAVDSNEQRHIISAALRTPVKWIVDMRMGGHVGQIYTVNREEIDNWDKFVETTLIEPQTELPCTERAIMYMGYIIAGLAAQNLVLALKDGPYQPKINIDAMNKLFL